MPPPQHILLEACRTLFGDELCLGPEFLAYLQPSGAKNAFRTRVKQHHPDRFAAAAPEVRAMQTARFREIHQAYRLLSSYLEQRRPARPAAAPPKPAPRPAWQPPHATSGRGLAQGVPPLPMEFGLFAYYRGMIDYRDLIDALVWQRRQRPAIGVIACQWGWLDEGAVRRVLSQRGRGGRFGRKAVELGLLSPLQVEALLRHQRAGQRRIGHYFIDRGLMTADEADTLARQLAGHNAQFALGRCR